MSVEARLWPARQNSRRSRSMMNTLFVSIRGVSEKLDDAHTLKGDTAVHQIAHIF